MLLGLIAARDLHGDFASIVRRDVLEPLGLHDTFYDVKPAQMTRYARGYASEGKPRRLRAGPLAAEAYGTRTTATDLLRFLFSNMGLAPLDGALRRAILATHAGYDRVGAMTQDLI